MKWRHPRGNDRWIISRLEGRRGGYFVEAGALDGVRGSATWALEKHFGWTGICVEPLGRSFEQLRRNRTCSCDSRCLLDRAGEVEFVEVGPGSEGYSGIAEYLDPVKREHWEHGTRVPKPAVTLTQLLREHAAPAVIDYLALDTEGSERQILLGLDFSACSVTAISIKGHHCTDLLLAAGYQQVSNPFSDVEFECYYVRR